MRFVICARMEESRKAMGYVWDIGKTGIRWDKRERETEGGGGI